MRSMLAALALSVALSVVGLAGHASAAEYSAPAVAHVTRHWGCECARDWAHRQYWQWDHRPIWDDPWQVLKPNFWGSPEPHLVPADIWARKWHPPWLHYWRPHHRHARRDP
jgi:hypothetical protein